MDHSNIYLLYHFFYPDDVISARLFSELGRHFADRGHRVVALPGRCGCHDYRSSLPAKEQWQGISIERVFRPRLSQHRFSGRVINALFMLAGWSFRALWMPRRRNEVMIVGTDPILAVLVTIAWRIFRPSSRIVHWCHDLYPDAAIADGMLRETSLLNRCIRWVLRRAYRRCDVIADLGPCMRHRMESAFGGTVIRTNDDTQNFIETFSIDDTNDQLDEDLSAIDYSAALSGESDSGVQVVAEAKRTGTELRPDTMIRARNSVLGVGVESSIRRTTFTTLVPWSLVEPECIGEADQAVRSVLFGQHTKLGLLYSGNMGRAHDHDTILSLARRVRGENVKFCFAGRGPGIDHLRSAVTEDDVNIRFAGFADESELLKRLTATDVHLVTLRDKWTGTVVPSKFFGALAVGRPVLFAGGEDSAIAVWIKKYGLGWVLNDRTVDEVHDGLQYLSENPDQFADLQERCFEIYKAKFAKHVQLAKWDLLVGGRFAGA